MKIDNELLRRQFAEKANVVGPWIERQLDAVTAIGLGLQVIHQTRRDLSIVYTYIFYRCWMLHLYFRELSRISYIVWRNTNRQYINTKPILRNWRRSTKRFRKAWSLKIVTLSIPWKHCALVGNSFWLRSIATLTKSKIKFSPEIRRYFEITQIVIYLYKEYYGNCWKLLKKMVKRWLKINLKKLIKSCLNLKRYS